MCIYVYMYLSFVCLLDHDFATVLNKDCSSESSDLSRREAERRLCWTVEPCSYAGCGGMASYARYGAVWYVMLPDVTHVCWLYVVSYRVMSCHVMHVMSCHVMSCHVMSWHGTIRYGTIRYGTVWNGMAWYGVACYNATYHSITWHILTCCTC